MSDFDKEAERERLREKYEKEQEKREVTEKMSELLLQGATMTNAHCSDCGDPIFRYDGQEFCATCEKAVERDTGQEDGADGEGEGNEESADGAENGQPDDQIEVTKPSDQARVRFGAEGEGDAESERTGQAPGADAEPQQGDVGSVDAGRVEDTAPVEPTPASASPTADENREVPGVEPGGVGDLEAARASLTRTVTDLAQRAEATDDLGRKRELLEATEEAAEALEAVRDAGR